MKKLKIPVKKRKTSSDELDKFRFEDSFNPHKLLRIFFFLSVTFIPVALSLYYLRYAHNVNTVFSFPLDDPWIHLTFAKNLAHYFSFSYFKNEMVTAGSTSPLYTIIAAFFFLVTNNEMIISYTLGILFFALASLSFFKLSVLEFNKDYLFALICSGFFIIDKWMNFISLSGMETTMFIFLLVLCSYLYKTRRAVPFAVMLGLVIWARPDGAIFIIAVIIDYIMVLIYSGSNSALKLFSGNDLKKIALIFLGILALYFGMNLLLSGSLMPNTYGAKMTYYSPELRSRSDFLSYEVWGYFKTGAYFLLMAGFIFSFLKLLFDLKKKSYNQNTLYILFILGLVFVYWLKLPYAHRFGRYMMPIIPFFILVANIGLRDLGRFLNKYTQNPLFSKIVFYSLVSIAFIMSIKNYDENKQLYADQSKYIYDRQVQTAYWLRDNTNENDIIATHDIGAIGFYSNRKIVDIAGLVTPDLISKIRDDNYVQYMTDYLRDKGVTYVAVMREWYRVSNQNPVFLTPNNNSPELIEVFKFEPDSTHILSREGNLLLMNAQTLIEQKAGQQILYITNRMAAIEPKSAFTFYLMANGHFLLKEYDKCERNLLRAIELFPDYEDAHFFLAEFYKNQNRYEEAKIQYSKTLEINPKNRKALGSLNSITSKLEKDKSKPDK